MKIKKLKFNTDERGDFIADSPFFRYRISENFIGFFDSPYSWCFYNYDYTYGTYFPCLNIEDGIAKAQEHFEKSVKECLENEN